MLSKHVVMNKAIKPGSKKDTEYIAPSISPTHTDTKMIMYQLKESEHCIYYRNKQLGCMTRLNHVRIN